MTGYSGLAGNALDLERLAAFARRSADGLDEHNLELDVQDLRGGLEAAAVARVTARFRESGGRSRAFTFVAKYLDGPARREAAIYADMLEPYLPGVAPRLLGVEAVTPAAAYLYLEHIRP